MEGALISSPGISAFSPSSMSHCGSSACVFAASGNIGVHLKVVQPTAGIALEKYSWALFSGFAYGASMIVFADGNLYEGCLFGNTTSTASGGSNNGYAFRWTGDAIEVVRVFSISSGRDDAGCNFIFSAQLFY